MASLLLQEEVSLTAYEQQRLETIASNKSKMAALGVGAAAEVVICVVTACLSNKLHPAEKQARL